MRRMKPSALFISTFLIVFFAELGDKTQIAAFSLAAHNGEFLSVAIGAVLGFVLSTVVAVGAGHMVAAYLPEKVLKRVSAVLFILTGVYLLVRTIIGG